MRRMSAFPYHLPFLFSRPLVFSLCELLASAQAQLKPRDERARGAVRSAAGEQKGARDFGLRHNKSLSSANLAAAMMTPARRQKKRKNNSFFFCFRGNASGCVKTVGDGKHTRRRKTEQEAKASQRAPSVHDTHRHGVLVPLLCSRGTAPDARTP